MRHLQTHKTAVPTDSPGRLLSGVDLKTRLLPRLSTLLVSGPKGPASSATGNVSRPGGGMSVGVAGAVGMTVDGSSSGRAAWAVSDQGRQAQMTWRRSRQQLLLTLGQQLGAMADPVQHIK